MKLNHKYETHSWRQHQHLMLVRHSQCGRYHICRLPDGSYKFVESHARKLGYPVLSADFSSLSDAQAFADKQEANRLKVWHYFVELAERNKRAADEWVENPVPVAGICKQGYREDNLKDVDYIADDLYAYHKYRAHLCLGNSWDATAHTDPAAWREWQARLDGTYIQYWVRRAS